ncbi:hypothetical protein V1509DRAFT_614996 [Lipomyces kononenkoae]
MWTKLSQNIKQAWNKTVQEFHEFEAQQDTKRQNKRRAEQSRLRRQARLQGLLVHSTLPSATKDACENGANITIKKNVIEGDKDIDAHERKKRRKVDNIKATASSVEQLFRSASRGASQEVNLSEELQEFELPRIESREPTKELASSPYSPQSAWQSLSSARSAGASFDMHTASSIDTRSAAVERWLRKRIVQLERELQESRDLIQRLHEQLGEQDDYIRAMEFEKSRVEENRVTRRSDRENNAHRDIEFARSVMNRGNGSPNLSRGSPEPDVVEVVDEKSFEQMSPVPLADLISQTAE